LSESGNLHNKINVEKEKFFYVMSKFNTIHANRTKSIYFRFLLSFGNVLNKRLALHGSMKDKDNIVIKVMRT
jgi:hypothetical protein